MRLRIAVAFAIVLASASARRERAGADDGCGDVAELASRLKEGDAAARARAVRALAAIGGDDASAAIRGALADSDPAVRHEAAIALAELRRPDERVVDVLARSLRGEEWYVRWQACLALQSLGARARAAVPALLDVLRDERQDVAREAVIALGAIAPREERVVLALVEFLGAHEGAIGDLAALVLSNSAGGNCPSAAAPLVKILKSERTTRHETAWKLLDALGCRSTSVLAELVDASDRETRCRAIDELGASGAAEALPYLLAAMRDPDPYARLSGVRALDEFDDLPAEALRELTRVARAPTRGSTTDADANRTADEVRAVAIGQLGRFAGRYTWLADILAEPEFRAARIALLRSEDAETRAAAAVALARMGHRGRHLIPTLLALLTDPSPDVQGATRFALARVGAESLACAVADRGGEQPELALKFDFEAHVLDWEHHVLDFQQLRALLTDAEIGEEVLAVLAKILDEGPEVTLRDALRSRNRSERACATILIERVSKNPDIAQALLRDPFANPDLRAVPDLDREAVERSLRDLGHNADSVRAAAAARLLGLGWRAEPYLERARQSEDAVLRAAANDLYRRRVEFWARIKSGSGIDESHDLPRNVVDKVTGIELLLVPAGTYMMGISPGDDEVRSGERNSADEQPTRRVMIAKPFYIGKYEVTNAQWVTVMKRRPLESSEGNDAPVVRVSWDDVQPFLRRTGLRLPTDAEWEYACRAGTKGARYGPRSEISVAPIGAVGRGRPNAFGLYDMIGHVWEWCADARGVVPLEQRKFLVPRGAPFPQYRTLRGGGAGNSDGYWLRASVRPCQVPWYRKGDLGFRVARDP